MSAPGNDRNGEVPASLEQLVLAGLGWISLGAEAVDQLADELARRVGIDRTEMRDAVRDTVASWRAEAERVTERRGETADGLIRRLGLVRREEVDELELRLAQLEHRLRLLERPATPSPD